MTDKIEMEIKDINNIIYTAYNSGNEYPVGLLLEMMFVGHKELDVFYVGGGVGNEDEKIIYNEGNTLITLNNGSELFDGDFAYTLIIYKFFKYDSINKEKLLSSKKKLKESDYLMRSNIMIDIDSDYELGCVIFYKQVGTVKSDIANTNNKVGDLIKDWNYLNYLDRRMDSKFIDFII